MLSGAPVAEDGGVAGSAVGPAGGSAWSARARPRERRVSRSQRATVQSSLAEKSVREGGSTIRELTKSVWPRRVSVRRVSTFQTYCSGYISVFDDSRWSKRLTMFLSWEPAAR